MKRKTIYSFLTFVLALAFGLCAIACFGKDDSASNGTLRASVVQSEEGFVVIKVDSVEGEVTLVQVMDYLQDEGELSFVIGSDGMVNEINGQVNNTVIWTPFWYLYTSDEEMSNTQWGTASYGDIVCGSAMFGAESLTVLSGAYYIWEYK